MTVAFAGATGVQYFPSTTGATGDPRTFLMSPVTRGRAPVVGDLLIFQIWTGEDPFDAGWAGPAGFTPLFPWANLAPTPSPVAYATWGLYYRFVQAGDGNYTFPRPSTSVYTSMLWMGGAASVGNFTTTRRADPGSGATTTNAVALPVTCEVGDTILSLAYERTTAAETDESVTFSPTPEWKYVFHSGSELFTQSIRTATQTTSGPTTIGFTNAHWANAIASNIVLKPVKVVIEPEVPLDTPEYAGVGSRQVLLASNAGAVKKLTLTSAGGRSVETGDCVFAVFTTGGPDVDPAFTGPVGFTEIRKWQNDRPSIPATMTYGLYYRIRQEGDANYYEVVTPNVDVACSLIWYTNVASVGASGWGARHLTGTNYTATAPSVLCSPGDTILVATMERTLATEDYSDIIFNPVVSLGSSNYNTSYSDNWSMNTRIADSTTSGTSFVEWPNPHSAGHNALVGNIVLKGTPVSERPPGLACKIVEDGSLTDARVQVTDASGELQDVHGVRMIKPLYKTVSEMMAAPEFFWAHRGGSMDYPEMSKHAYTQSALLGYSVLEISVQMTVDGVWFGIHDQYLDRTSLGTSTTTLDARTMTWAEVQQYEILASVVTNDTDQPNRPYVRLDEMIDTYPNHLFVVDLKNSVGGSRTTAALDMLDARGGPDRFIMKQYGMTADSFFLDACTARGYLVWGFFWGTDMASPNAAARVDRWPLLGINYNITPSEKSVFDSYKTKGQRVVAHIIPDADGVETARALGYDAFQCSGVRDVAPVMWEANTSQPSSGQIGIHAALRFDQNELVIGHKALAPEIESTVQLLKDNSVVAEKPVAADTETSWASTTFDGLTPDTAYDVRFTVAGKVQNDAYLTNISTLPTAGAAKSFKVLAGSCQFTGSNHPIFDRMREEKALFLSHMGDLHYKDSLTEPDWRSGVEASIGAPRYQRLMKTLPMEWTWDNHDRILVNSGGAGTALNLGSTDPRTAVQYKKLAGSGAWASDAGMGRSWQAGRVLFIQTDLWTERDDPDFNPPSPATFLGPQQKQWFKDTVAAANADVGVKLIIWFSQWTNQNYSNGRWGSFPAESTELEGVVAGSAKPFVMIGGDSHQLHADSGTRTAAQGQRFVGTPSLNMSGFNRSSNEQDAALGWDLGTAPLRTGTTPETDVGGYSRINITDDGSSLTMHWEAVRVVLDGSVDVMSEFTRTY